MTVLAFTATATIGSLRYERNLSEAHVTLALAPGVGSARLVLPRDVPVDAGPGDDVEVALTGESTDATTVLTGTVHSVRRGLDRTTVLCGDATAALAAIRTGATFEQQSAAAIIHVLAGEADAGTGSIDADLDLPTYVAHQGRTALEHVTTLASWAGCIVAASADGKLDVVPIPEPPAGTALRYGREIAELRVTTPAPQAALVVAGNGPAGNASAPDARTQTTAVVPDGADGPSATAIRVPAPALRTPSAASNASDALAAFNGAARLTATCWLVPELRAGSTVEIADSPNDATGPWLVTRAEHRVGPGARGTTKLTAVAMSAGGLLGGLL